MSETTDTLKQLCQGLYRIAARRENNTGAGLDELESSWISQGLHLITQLESIEQSATSLLVDVESDQGSLSEIMEIGGLSDSQTAHYYRTGHIIRDENEGD